MDWLKEAKEGIEQNLEKIKKSSRKEVATARK